MPKAPARVAQLDYDAARERLTGVIGEAQPFNLIAASSGEPLPSGHYECRYIAHHRRLFECIQLVRMGASAFPVAHAPGKGFFIHAPGFDGSDGSIVPVNNAERLRLNAAVKEFRGLVMLRRP
jgi:hypothetical protein